MEAALAGHPVVAGPSRCTAPTTKPDKPRKMKSEPKTQKLKKNDERITRKEQKLLVVKQAITNVGRMPSKVLRYLELMSNHLSEEDKKYYSSVGKKGGPSRDAALKRVARKITSM